MFKKISQKRIIKLTKYQIKSSKNVQKLKKKFQTF